MKPPIDSTTPDAPKNPQTAVGGRPSTPCSRVHYGPLYAMLVFRAVVIMSGAAVCVLGTWWHSIPLVCIGLLAGGTFSVGSTGSDSSENDRAVTPGENGKPLE